MALETPYNLGFNVYYEKDRLLSAHSTIYIKIVFKDTPDEETLHKYDACVVDFCCFASSGAMPGERAAPWDCSAFPPHRIITQGNYAIWELSEWKSGDKAIIVFAQWLQEFQQEFSINSLLFSSNMEFPVMDMLGVKQKSNVVNPYPELWHQLPFSVNLDEDFYGDATLYITWSDTPDEDTEEAIIGTLRIWGEAVYDGMYPVAPLMPNECTVLYDDENIECVGTTTEFPFSRFRAHWASLDALINICASLHHIYLPIKRIVIE